MHNKFRRDPRDMEEEEECWFDREDEEGDDIDINDDCYTFEPNFTEKTKIKGKDIVIAVYDSRN